MIYRNSSLLDTRLLYINLTILLITGLYIIISITITLMLTANNSHNHNDYVTLNRSYNPTGDKGK